MDCRRQCRINCKPAFDVLSAKGISAISKLVDKVGELDGEKIAAKLTSGLDKIKPYWDVLVATASEVGSAFGDAFSAISKELAELNGSFGSTESVEGFGNAIGVAGDALKNVCRIPGRSCRYSCGVD